ncbi:hypothetical protein D9M69_413820 [compost metagenome]
MGADGVGGSCGPDGAVDVAGQGLALVRGAVDVEVQVQGLGIAERNVPVQVAVVLTPDVFQFTTVQAGADVVVEGVGAAYIVGAIASDTSVSGSDFAVAVGGNAAVTDGGEVAGVNVQAFDLAAGQLEAFSGAREQASGTGGEYRSSREQVAVLQLGVGHLHLDGAASVGVIVRGFAVVADRQQAGTIGAATAVQLQAQHAVGVNAEANGTLGITGLEVQGHTMSPLVAVALAIGRVVAEVTVEREVLVQKSQVGIFYEAFGLFLGAGECQLHATGGHGQSQCAPLHHLHCDCSFGFEDSRRFLIHLKAVLSFCVGANL